MLLDFWSVIRGSLSSMLEIGLTWPGHGGTRCYRTFGASSEKQLCKHNDDLILRLAVTRFDSLSDEIASQFPLSCCFSLSVGQLLQSAKKTNLITFHFNSIFYVGVHYKIKSRTFFILFESPVNVTLIILLHFTFLMKP